MRKLHAVAAATMALAATIPPADAQQSGGIVRIGHFDSPASMSPLEESTAAVNRPMMGVFNNLVVYDQHVRQNSPDSIVPELATGWQWSEDGTELTMPLRQGVKWHDGKPFTAADVKCTFALLQGTAKEKLRLNPRKAWFDNLVEITSNGDYEVAFRLKRPQASFLAMLSTGWTPMYPCHVSPAQMRLHPIGTGPFKFVEFKPNEVIRVAKNPDYWKKGLPYLDGIEYPIIKDVSTRLLAFVAGKTDVYHGATMPQLKDIKNQMPQAVCDLYLSNTPRNLLVNPQAPLFENPEIRRAMALTIDRKAFVDILAEGQGAAGGMMQPPPDGLWGMPKEMLQTLPGYDPDVGKSRGEARRLMEKAGYGPNSRLAVTVSTRNIQPYRDAAIILIDQLREIYIDATLDPIDTTQWYPTLMRKDYKVAVDDPDPTLYENYVCGAQRNYSGYCNKEIDRLVDQQSAEPDAKKRQLVVWEIEKKLAEDAARPILFYQKAANCVRPEVKGLTTMANSIYNQSRFEDLWLEQGIGSSSQSSVAGAAR
jgi:peptide/nickel transport system substrate-binding protein